MINFIGSEAQTGHAGTDKNITTTQQKTGYEGDNDILKNIYDLEGNNYEWTAQAYDRVYRVKRGGNYLAANKDWMGIYFPASKCDRLDASFKPDYTVGNTTSRISLYL